MPSWILNLRPSQSTSSVPRCFKTGGGTRTLVFTAGKDDFSLYYFNFCTMLIYFDLFCTLWSCVEMFLNKSWLGATLEAKKQSQQNKRAHRSSHSICNYEFNLHVILAFLFSPSKFISSFPFHCPTGTIIYQKHSKTNIWIGTRTLLGLCW